jgi:rSAM/selenodomain-associated transferase 2
MRVSVVVPALNEERVIGATLAGLRGQHPHEVIVADGGSTDATAGVAARLADRVIAAPRGRAVQMNAGAAAATGDALLFLHADCALEDGALAEAARLLRYRPVAAGCFRMVVQGRGVIYRLIDAAATLRVRLTGIGYGDQGLFVRRDVFERAGGFPSVRLMEDVLLSLRLRRLGRFVVAGRRVFVSARRWQAVGAVRQTLRNWALTALAVAGTHPDRLAAYYPNVR